MTHLLACLRTIINTPDCPDGEHPFRVIKRQFGHVKVRYQMLAGLFRFVCHNGLVYGDTTADIRIPHTEPDSN